METSSGTYRGILKRDGVIVARVSAKTAELCWERLRAKERGENPLLLQLDKAPTLSSFASSWLKLHIGARGEPVKPSSSIGHEQKIRLHIVPYFGTEVRVDEITPKMVAAFFRHMRDQGCSNSTIANTRNTLSAILGYARLEGHINENSARGHHVGEAGSGFMVAEGMDDKIGRKIIDAVRDSKMRDILSLLLYCPMREGEMLRIDWSNVHLNSKRITVLKTETKVFAAEGSGNYSTRGSGTPKTRAGKRIVPIPSEAERLLRRRYMEMGHPSSGLVFPGYINPLVPISAKSLLNELKKTMTAAGLNIEKVHEIRHIGISLLLAAGVDPNVVAQVAGHANANITRRFYAHVLDGRAQAAAETLTFFGPSNADSATAKNDARMRSTRTSRA